MGEPAELTPVDRAYAHTVADEIVERVRDEESIIEMLPSATVFDHHQLMKMDCRDELCYVLLVMAQEIQLMRQERDRR